MNISEPVQSSFAEREGMTEQEDPGEAVEWRRQGYKAPTGSTLQEAPQTPRRTNPSCGRWGNQGPEKKTVSPVSHSKLVAGATTQVSWLLALCQPQKRKAQGLKDKFCLLHRFARGYPFHISTLVKLGSTRSDLYSWLGAVAKQHEWLEEGGWDCGRGWRSSWTKVLREVWVFNCIRLCKRC